MSDAERIETPVVRPTHPWRRRLAGAAFTIAVLSGALALIAVALTQEKPAWWSVIDAHDPAVIAAAQRVENGAATQLTKIRQQSDEVGGVGGDGSSAPWTVALKASDANAWLATRLGKWMENQEAEENSMRFKWPKELGQVQVRFEGGVIGVGASVRSSERKLDAENGVGSAGETMQVLAASIRPELRPDGSLWMPARWVSLGKLSVPASWMLPSPTATADGQASKKHASVTKANVPDTLRDLPQTRDMLAVFSGDVPAMKRPIIRIGDGRRVELLSLEPRDGVLLITCRTLPREQNTASKEPVK